MRKTNSLMCAATTALVVAAPSVAAGDAARGAEVFHYKCAVCHAIAPEFHKEGPSLHGVFGRRAGTAPFFPRYKALKGVDFTWSEESMDRFLAEPRAFLDGRYTKMTLKLDDARARADVIAFLKTLQ